MEERNKRVLVGMSGGIDSTATCLMLQEQGYEIVGVTMRVWGDEPQDARELAERMGIEHYVADERIPFKETIVKNFIDEYKQGRTPNPCVMCNPLFKFRVLTEWADKLGCKYIATGHYAQNIQLNETFYITYAADSDKDQTFFLWGLKQDILNRMLLPMGDITKAEARAWAAEHGFRKVATKKDSIGVCFCPMDYRTFLKDWLVRNGQMSVSNSEASINNSQTSGSDKQTWSDRIRRGRFVDEKGNFIAWHEGYPFYTIGQRRGLGIHLNRPVFVKEIDPENNEVMLASLSSLEKTEMWLKDWNLVNPQKILGYNDVIVKIRYRKQENHCTVTVTPDNLLHVQLHEPLTAIAAGQAAAFYRDGLLLGGGIIVNAR